MRLVISMGPLEAILHTKLASFSGARCVWSMPRFVLALGKTQTIPSKRFLLASQLSILFDTYGYKVKEYLIVPGLFSFSLAD
jgi:hypothetical protein